MCNTELIFSQESDSVFCKKCNCDSCCQAKNKDIAFKDRFNKINMYCILFAANRKVQLGTKLCKICPSVITKSDLL
jgi:hypothetical protein